MLAETSDDAQAGHVLRGQLETARANGGPRNSRERRSVPGPGLPNQTLVPSPWKARSWSGGLETLYTLRATFFSFPLVFCVVLWAGAGMASYWRSG